MTTSAIKMGRLICMSVFFFGSIPVSQIKAAALSDVDKCGPHTRFSKREYDNESKTRLRVDLGQPHRWSR